MFQAFCLLFQKSFHYITLFVFTEKLTKQTKSFQLSVEILVLQSFHNVYLEIYSQSL
jgi:hypothetical protein